MTTLASQKKPASRTLKHRQAELVITIGQRMKESRELCNLSLSEAARLLGYTNPSKLSKVENATDTLSVPFWLIPQAAKLYDVSTEFLFGLSDEWETGCWRGVSPFLIQTWDAQRARDLKALAVLNRRVIAAVESFPTLAEAAQNALGAVEAFTLQNKNFDDLPGGARLMAAARRLRTVTTDAVATQKRLHLDLPPEMRSEEAASG